MEAEQRKGEPKMIDLERAIFRRIKRANTDWWIREHAVAAQNGKNYIGYVTDTGEVHLKEFDARCSRAPSRDVCLCRLNADYADEHNAPAVCVPESGRIAVAYTGHGKSASMRLRVMERPFDMDSFGPEKEIRFNGAGRFQGGVTYAQLSENEKRGELWLFCRVDKVNWEFCYSSDGGDSWNEPRRFLHSDGGGLFYLDVRKMLVKTPEGPAEEWFFALYGHPRISGDHKIRSGVFSSDGRLKKTDGTPTSLSLFENDGMIDLDALDTVYAAPEGETVRLLDVSAAPPYRVAFAPFALTSDDAPDPSLPTYYSASFRDGAWRVSKPIAKAGGFLADHILDGSQTYLPGMAYYFGVGDAGFHKNSACAKSFTDRVYLARFEEGTCVLESYLTQNGGESYEFEQEICRVTGENKIWRPTVPLYAGDNLPVYWHEGVYTAHSGGWHSDVVMPVEYDD